MDGARPTPVLGEVEEIVDALLMFDLSSFLYAPRWFIEGVEDGPDGGPEPLVVAMVQCALCFCKVAVLRLRCQRLPAAS